MQPNIPSIPFCEPCGALMSASCRELAECVTRIGAALLARQKAEADLRDLYRERALDGAEAAGTLRGARRLSLCVRREEAYPAGYPARRRSPAWTKPFVWLYFSSQSRFRGQSGHGAERNIASFDDSAARMSDANSNSKPVPRPQAFKAPQCHNRYLLRVLQR
jgi:hypothetical protein